jgi:LysR family transcriptional regulator, hydrogen peroxide-inducible genes activator
MITLRQLRYLTALARRSHFGRAAEDCAVSQPSLSQQIADLEAALGTQLIDRSGRKAALTDIGVAIATRAQSILAAVADLSRVAKEGEQGLASLRFGVIPTIAPFLLPTALPAIRRISGGAGLRVHEAMTGTLLSEIRNNTLDVALLALPVSEAGIETLALFEDPFFLATSAASRLKGPIVAADLNAGELLLLDDGHCLREQALSLCGGATGDLREQLGATSLSTLASLVAAGLGQTLVPAMALDALFSGDKRVRIVPFRKPAPARTIGLAFRSTASNKPAIRRLGEAIAAARPRAA